MCESTIFEIHQVGNLKYIDLSVADIDGCVAEFEAATALEAGHVQKIQLIFLFLLGLPLSQEVIPESRKGKVIIPVERFPNHTTLDEALLISRDMTRWLSQSLCQIFA